MLQVASTTTSDPYMAMVDDLIEKGSEFSFRGTDDELDVRSAVEASLGYEDLGAAEQDMRIRWLHSAAQQSSQPATICSEQRLPLVASAGAADLAQSCPPDLQHVSTSLAQLKPSDSWTRCSEGAMGCSWAGCSKAVMQPGSPVSHMQHPGPEACCGHLQSP